MIISFNKRNNVLSNYINNQDVHLIFSQERKLVLCDFFFVFFIGVQLPSQMIMIQQCSNIEFALL